MKLIVQIPCLNEAESLAATVRDLPRKIPGIDAVEVLVIDDGSHDGTSDVASAAGVEHIVRHRGTRGLAAAFQTGLTEGLRRGADIIVNTDGDNQYAGADIPALIRPILEGTADIVIGDRQCATLPQFTRGKRWLQRLGSWVVRRVSGVEVPDAVSGFRAFSRSATQQLHVVSRFSYTVETLIQAGERRLRVASVPVRTHRVTRPSRLFRSTPEFIARSVATLLRAYAVNHAWRLFGWIGLALLLIGSLPVVRFVWLYFAGNGTGHIQSLVIGGVCLVCGVVMLLMGLVCDLLAVNRRLTEMTLEQLRGLEDRLSSEPSGDSRPAHDNQSSRTSSWDGERLTRRHAPHADAAPRD
jgi:glycosyltransferase involved in cell wall biosynthesis